MTTVAVSRTPEASLLAPFLDGSDFVDAYEIALADPKETPAQLFARALAFSPPWVDAALRLRDSLVRPFGIRTVGAMRSDRRPPFAPKVGDAFGIFTVFAIRPDELLLGIDDRHLDVRVSIAKQTDPLGARAVVSTAVRNHNWLGRLYMIPVARIHPLVVRAMLKRL